MRVIFMGTPDFAVRILEEIIAAGHEVALAVTQPDKPKGRGNAVVFSPVKECALSHGIEVFQPVRIRDEENVLHLREFAPDIIIVAAFGQILPKSILDLPEYGCVNIHASLLPKYRGASPIQWAIINGDQATGVTAMRMDAGMDTGDMIAERVIPIEKDETGGSLFDRLSEEGAGLCVETMDAIEGGTAVFTPQNHGAATYTTLITKEHGNIDWTKPAEEIERLVRGLNPWPSAYTHLGGRTFKIWRAFCIKAENGCGQGTGAFAGCRCPGSIVLPGKHRIAVQTGDGLLELAEVQLEGKKRMDAAAFLNGYPLADNTVLTS